MPFNNSLLVLLNPAFELASNFIRQLKKYSETAGNLLF